MTDWYRTSATELAAAYARAEGSPAGPRTRPLSRGRIVGLALSSEQTLII
jgi:hypothetical protein